MEDTRMNRVHNQQILDEAAEPAGAFSRETGSAR